MLRNTHYGCNPPAWFISHLIIHPLSEVIVLDDDKAIYMLWRKFLPKGIKVRGFDNYQSFAACLEMIKPNTLFLVDYNLHSGIDGVEIIIKHALKDAVLVTIVLTRTIEGKCKEHGIKILPKCFIPVIPVKVNP